MLCLFKCYKDWKNNYIFLLYMYVLLFRKLLCLDFSRNCVCRRNTFYVKERKRGWYWLGKTLVSTMQFPRHPSSPFGRLVAFKTAAVVTSHLQDSRSRRFTNRKVEERKKKENKEHRKNKMKENEETFKLTKTKKKISSIDSLSFFFIIYLTNFSFVYSRKRIRKEKK